MEHVNTQFGIGWECTTHSPSRGVGIGRARTLSPATSLSEHSYSVTPFHSSSPWYNAWYKVARSTEPGPTNRGIGRVMDTES